MKKLFYILVILIFGLSITACGGSKKEEVKAEDKATTVETQKPAEETQEIKEEVKEEEVKKEEVKKEEVKKEEEKKEEKKEDEIK